MEIKEVKYISDGEEKSYLRAEVNRTDLIHKPLWFHNKGLSETRSGYGSKLRTVHMIKHNNKLYRIYCICYSNAGSLYILSKGKKIYVDVY